MKKLILIGTIGLMAGTLIAADAKEDVKSAAKKLAATSYSWKSTAEMGGGRGGGDTDGKCAKDGTVRLSMARGDTTTEAYLKGEKGAIKTQEGWQSLAELTGDGGGGGQRNRGAFLARMLRNYKAPAVEVEDLVSTVSELKSAEGVLSGDMTAEGVKSMMRFGGRGGQGPDIQGPKGSVKIWLKNGELSKYQYNVQGKMTFGEREFDMNRTTTIEIKDVGSTTFEVPAEAKAKLQ